MTYPTFQTLSGALLLAGSALCCDSAWAQLETPSPAVDSAARDNSAQLEEIIVTAEKRSGSLQKTPVAVSALSGEMLVERQIRAINDVQTLVPNFSMGSSIGVAQIAIRGIGTTAIVPGAEGAVAVNINDIYVSRPVAQLAGVYDVTAVEVLRGPQGTLYGRNATAGSVNISTALPTSDPSGYGRLSIGNYQTINFDGALSGPVLGDALTARLAVSTNDRDGYGENLVTGKDIDDRQTRAVRLTLHSNFTDDVSATLFADYYDQNDASGALHYFGAAGLIPVAGTLGMAPFTLVNGGYVASDKRDIASQLDTRFELETWSVTGKVEADLGSVSLKSMTGYRSQKTSGLVDLSGGSRLGGFYTYGEPAHQFSQELQAAVTTERLNLTAGVYYFSEHDRTHPGHAPFTALALAQQVGAPAPSNPDLLLNVFQATGLSRTKAYAAFSQGTYQLTDALSVTAGLRYSHERKTLSDHYFGLDFTTPFALNIAYPTTWSEASFHNFSPKLGVNFQLTPQTFLYASYSRGFKSGGFDVGANSPAYRPEKLTDYEAGIKTTLLDNRLRLNLAGFDYDYKDLQVQQVINNALITTNAATASIYGLETEITVLPVPSVSIDASLSYLHARFDQYAGADPARPLLLTADFNGNRLPNAPDWRSHVSAQKTWYLGGDELKLRGEADYSSRNYFAANNFKQLSQDAVTRFNAFLTYDAGSWYVTGFMRNITDKTVKSSLFVATATMGNPILGGLEPPRTFGFEVGHHF